MPQTWVHRRHSSIQNCTPSLFNDEFDVGAGDGDVHHGNDIQPRQGRIDALRAGTRFALLRLAGPPVLT